MQQTRLAYLFNKYLQGFFEQEEKEELFQLSLQPENKSELDDLFSHYVDREEGILEMSTGQTDELYKRIVRQINEFRSPQGEADGGITRPVHRVHFLKTAWFRYAAAIIIIFGIGAYLWSTQPKKNPETTQSNPALVQNDVLAPTTATAIITLADGKKISLDSVQNGSLGKNLRKIADGQLSYDPGGSIVEYHTLTVPRGSKIVTLILADGSKVWLNSESMLRYPTAFIDQERKVEITGEAYFEVAKDAGKKFFVMANGMVTEVLGTHFNVNAYKDEPFSKITLLEGSVKVSNNGATNILQPGQQAQVSRNGDAKKTSINVESTDVSKAVAWKDGIFNFNKLPLKDAMRQLGRWYNVEIVYENNLPTINFYGEIGRDLKLSQVLNGLSGLGIKFTLEEGNRLVVSKG